MLFPTSLSALLDEPFLYLAVAAVCLLLTLRALRSLRRVLLPTGTLLRAGIAASLVAFTTTLALAMVAAAALAR
ncbi:hypothetical protein KZ829_19145 [Actinoplanes hulinensis]|uniref:Uncharacterized protein n=1 Tax=Actinoplanes hulinensis TaxID=1144547 RepID=A0ABS7B4G9_9ACTN|nr:hypothetical protein [Actinoplanes hulinensis]MBW6435860.1 hypothetical protein [Actinoplanes hulinensis]